MKEKKRVEHIEKNAASQCVLPQKESCLLPKDSVYCLAQHFKTFFKQVQETRIADFAEPCIDCSINSDCKYNWQEKLGPVFEQLDLKITLVRRER